MSVQKLCVLLSIIYVVLSQTHNGLRLPIKPRLTHTLSTSMGRYLNKDMQVRGDKGSRYLRDATWNIPLDGNLTYWGEYFATIGIGTPPQFVQLQVDSGSADLIVYSKNCDGCGNPVHFYDPSSSSTVTDIYCDNDQFNCMQTDECDDLDPCAWEDQFGDGSTIDGNVVQDVLTVGSTTTKTRVSLGTINSVDAPNGFEATGVDGIWGLAFEDLSGWGGTPAIQLIVDEFKLYNSFSLCLQEDGGIMTVGDDYSKDPSFQWTPITEDQWYTVYLENWFVGGTSLGLAPWRINWNGVIVDSGTTLLIVDTLIFTTIKTMMTNNCTKNPLVGVCGVQAGQGLFDGKCFNMTADQVAAFPDMSLSFNGMNSTLPITSQDYLWQGTGDKGVYCLGIQIYDDLPVIIGDVFMQNYHVVFDRQTDKVGFGPLSTCPSH